MNTANISGAIVKGPDLRQTANGAKVCNFSVSVERPNAKDITDYIDCVAWDKMADVVAGHKQGDWVSVNGIIITHTSTSQETGTKKRFTEIRVENIEFQG